MYTDTIRRWSKFLDVIQPRVTVVLLPSYFSRPLVDTHERSSERREQEERVVLLCYQFGVTILIIQMSFESSFGRKNEWISLPLKKRKKKKKKERGKKAKIFEENKVVLRTSTSRCPATSASIVNTTGIIDRTVVHPCIVENLYVASAIRHECTNADEFLPA